MRTYLLKETPMHALTSHSERIVALAQSRFDALYDTTEPSIVLDAKQLLMSTSSLRHISYGHEDFGNFVKRIMANVLNIIVRLLNRYKNVLRLFQNLKRTELRMYEERQLGTVMRVKSVAYVDVAELPCPIPKGMSKVGYVEATTALISCLRLLDMNERCEAFVDACSNIKTRVIQGQAGVAAAEILNQMSDLKSITAAFANCDKLFNGNNAETRPFMNLFDTKQEFLDEYKMLLDAEDYQYSVHRIFVKLEKCNNLLEEVVKAAEKNIIIAKEDLRSLANACLFMAQTFDMFGLTVQDLHRVEHNYVEILKLIVRTLNL